MKYDFVFSGDRTISFDLSPRDTEHALEHKTKMLSWDGPLGGSALSGVDWDKVQSYFPQYSLRCKECDFRGEDYDKYGELKNPEQKQDD